ncbi:MAG: LPS export ABC transporter periplasmic protein LptC [Candidatus Schekmanbacteria bacterium RIFCSPHIGHO2_02_FULL_38_11]|uniref:LPS export ABC transporter periplasmic protein LptC n=1 Tax=Candidatus Schekmanbacteria bacterium RIFCSPLOWO2_12_FULL_38_15 TaxID=1817883 RepID=A0A1F7SPC9_9BACT|nr:MAG: LPS export ABC transporter periplasmic protein LptC [Candidatus Schekmanbacteria bacterium GWA2_38_9]OGL48693.1 MAG: LPS export ABC transporter periplasmic protein LptC [Candidatus Schekmanbacteria bacterium RIFCSPHIGHO2_02_FULL_38_11]OGL51078.1 MAG: LPS export ABC transporter periplasmic protein LptC [Candidatus Schekmanbacteria bacterium RIFCSPLOWO2_02_FULL_38_14]OGL55078.1 MAG: LPS export ABC transporter periplasmic protein LptC [Candidatus Schekmanbacteria bacterium RIFCSPLOWO2_12_FU
MTGLSLIKKNKSAIYITMILFLLVLVAISGYFMNTSKNLGNKKTELTKNKATISIQPLVFSQEVENKNKFILSADSAKFFQEQGKGILKNFSITYIYNGGKKLTISGANAEVNINANRDFSQDISIANIYSGGKITAVSSEGYRFETKDLVWNGDRKVISTKEPITFYGKNFKLTGEGLNADINNEEIEITSKVDVTAAPESLDKLKPENTNIKNPLGRKIYQ